MRIDRYRQRHRGRDDGEELRESFRADDDSKYQSAKPIGIEPITDSVTVTPIVTAKLIARKFNWPRHRDLLRTSSVNRRRAERPTRPRPAHSPAPDTPVACADSPIDASAARTFRRRASESDCPRRIPTTTRHVAHNVLPPQTCMSRTPFFIARAEQSTAATSLDTGAVELDRHDVRPRGHSLEPRGERVPERAIVNSASGFDGNLHSAANSDSFFQYPFYIPSGSCEAPFAHGRVAIPPHARRAADIRAIS